MQNLQQEYKGWTMKLRPQDEMCSSFAMEIVNPDGGREMDVPAAGKTEDRVFERGREFIDTRIAIG